MAPCRHGLSLSRKNQVEIAGATTVLTQVLLCWDVLCWDDQASATVIESWPIHGTRPWDSMPGAFLMLLQRSRKGA